MLILAVGVVVGIVGMTAVMAGGTWVLEAVVMAQPAAANPAAPWWEPEARESRFSRYTTAHYELITDVDAVWVPLITAELEVNYRLYRDTLEPHVPVPAVLARRHVMRIFASIEDFQKYHAQRWREAAPRVNFVFHYTPDPRFREVVGYFKSREPFFASLRHEGFHQVLRHHIAYPPQWINEGLAELLEETVPVEGRFVPKINKGWARQLREYIGPGRRYRPIDAPTLMQLPKAEWLRQSGSAYAFSWALAWFLKHEWADGKAILGRYLAALRPDAQRDDNVMHGWRATFGGPDAARLPELVAAFDAFTATIVPTPDFEGFEAARDLVAAQRFAEALARLDKAIERDPDGFYALYYFRAVALRGLGRHRDALIDLMRARDLFPEYIAAIWAAARAALDTSYFDLAEQLAVEARQIDARYTDRATDLLAEIRAARQAAVGRPNPAELAPLPRFGEWPRPSAND